ncbi:zinc transporter-domain containing protein [Nitzschia inconspicua]|uniref:Zinc transporter-domain containing protein n=1 Tax=Nitzschia inconspicua TaxID=303405 RepID=A0A9K3KHI3_9STRA|nr:zinc transporter-domain containing protein [Nitzschia inconspicua]
MAAAAAAAAVETAAVAPSTVNDDWVFPLLLSCMAGASTCVGAAVVFCFSSQQIKRSMSFSLSLAASVMITVSVISIGPECLHGIVSVTNGNSMLHSVNVWLLLERLLAFGAGCGGYFLLSKLLGTIPDPEQLFLFGNTSSNKKTEESNTVVMNVLKYDDHCEDGEHQQNEEHEALLLQQQQQQRPRRGSHDSSSSTESLGLELEMGDSRDNLDDGNSTTAQAGKLSRKQTPNHRLRRKMTTQTTGGSSTGNSRKDMRRLILSSSVDSFDSDQADRQNELSYDKDALAKQMQKQRSWRVAMLLFFSLLAHNFPEGLCVAASAKESPQLGITVAIGIFIHNVPEGIAISVPCIAARPESPWLAFWLASISGLAEPIGAIVALSVLQTTKLELENVLASVAGIMCMVAVMELYPEAIRQLSSSEEPGQIGDTNKKPKGSRTPSYRSIVWGTLAGMAMMIATEWYLPA